MYYYVLLLTHCMIGRPDEPGFLPDWGAHHGFTDTGDMLRGMMAAAHFGAYANLRNDQKETASRQCHIVGEM